MKHAARLVLAVTILALAVLALAPTGYGGGYTCDGPPIARLMDPDTETGSEYFFDAGAACNGDARARGWAMAVAAVAGFGASGALALVANRRGSVDGAGRQGSDGEQIRSIW